MQSADQWQYLLQRYLQNNATEEERMQLFRGLQRADVDWETLLTQAGLQHEPDVAYRESDWAAMLDRIVQEPTRKRNVFFMNRWWMAAAALVLVISGVWWLGSRSKQVQPATSPLATVQDVQSGKPGAILTLADGRQIVLDSVGNGSIAQQGSIVVRRDGGQLVYEKNGTGTPSGNTAAITYNTLRTPRGRQFELLLPDGSKVWLNAASSVKYPVVFSSNERRVEITGEAYFEITKNKVKPFIVDVNGKATVEVLGTHFNVNAYEDEDHIKTTLLEGSVSVQSAIGPGSAGSKSAILKPGEQASLSQTSHTSQPIPVQTVDVQQVTAWKNGLFDFQDVPLQQVMRQLARWYDVEVAYENGIPEIEFGGKMGRDLSLFNVLHFLEKSGLHCRLADNHRLIVTP